MSQTAVAIHGMPPWLSYREAGGQAQGGPADASAGLQIMEAGGQTWAWNTLGGEWQLLHMIRSGDTLWGLSARYYGSSSLPGVRLIGNVPQNKPILGPSFDKAIPGDVILIPGLEQPTAAPAPPAPGASPPPGGATPPGGELPPPGGVEPEPIVFPTTPPPGWPPGFPWPPVQIPGVTPDQPAPGEPAAGPAEQPPTDAPPTHQIPTQPPPYEPPPGTAGPGGAVPVLTGGRAANGNGKPGEPASWWTPTRIALAAVLGTTTAGLLIWGVAATASKPKRRTRRRRRR